MIGVFTANPVNTQTQVQQVHLIKYTAEVAFIYFSKGAH